MTEHFVEANPDDGGKRPQSQPCKTWAADIYEDAVIISLVLWK